MPPLPIDPIEIPALRQTHYNATLVDLRFCHGDLAFFRVLPDHPVRAWMPGQFATIGLGGWEARAPDTQPESLDAVHCRHLIRRAYSISAPILTPSGVVTPPYLDPVLEFYITLVRRNDGPPPALTPRLFCLKPGDRLHLAEKIAGHYTLAPMATTDTVLFFATGTGEAPHNAMTAELLSRGHTGPIVSAVCVRNQIDLGYLQTHRELERRFPNYHYLVATTRDPINLDPSVSGYVGKMYLQDLVRQGVVESAIGQPLEPSTSHVYLCGNPQMIGIPETSHEGPPRFPQPTGMVELLSQRGFTLGDRHIAGNIHFEKYW